MKILLTGGFGFIGIGFIKKFGNLHELLVFDKEGHNTVQNNFKIFSRTQGKLENHSLYEMIRKYQPEVTIHLAAFSGLKKCEENPHKAFKINVFGTFNVVNACLEAKSKLIFISSREVYGETLGNESKEDDLLLPKNVYGITKMLAENLVIYAGQKRNLDYTILRLTNVYGPHGIKRGVNNLIENAIKERKITINDGKQVLNLIYVDDVADVIMKTIKHNGSSKQVYNMGSQDNLTINEFSKKIIDNLNFDVKLEYTKKPDIETEKFRPSLVKLKNQLNFSCKTRINDGLKKTIKWYMENN